MHQLTQNQNQSRILNMRNIINLDFPYCNFFWKQTKPPPKQSPFNTMLKHDILQLAFKSKLKIPPLDNIHSLNFKVHLVIQLRGNSFSLPEKYRPFTNYIIATSAAIMTAA